MQDPVADVLAQRSALDRGAGSALLLSIILHGIVTALAVFTAMRQPPPRPVSRLNIRLASPRVRPTVPAAVRPKPKPPAPRIEMPAVSASWSTVIRCTG